MNVKKLYDYVLDQSQAVAVQVTDTQMNLPTPDTEWTVRDLMQHMMIELVWLPDMLNDKTVEEVGNAHDGELLGDNPSERWRLAVAAARNAMQKADMKATAHLSYADKQVADYLLDSATDLLIHTWDLGQAVGASVVFDKDAAETVYKHVFAHQKEIRGSGLFAGAKEVPEMANTQTKLLALMGRSGNWAESA